MDREGCVLDDAEIGKDIMVKVKDQVLIVERSAILRTFKSRSPSEVL